MSIEILISATMIVIYEGLSFLRLFFNLLPFRKRYLSPIADTRCLYGTYHTSSLLVRNIYIEVAHHRRFRSPTILHRHLAERRTETNLIESNPPITQYTSSDPNTSPSRNLTHPLEISSIIQSESQKNLLDLGHRRRSSQLRSNESILVNGIPNYHFGYHTYYLLQTPTKPYVFTSRHRSTSDDFQY